MICVTTTELKKLADASRLTIPDESIPVLRESLEDVLRYASRVAHIAQERDEPVRHIYNVVRDDVAVVWDRTPLLSYTSHADNNYFVVPAIL